MRRGTALHLCRGARRNTCRVKFFHERVFLAASVDFFGFLRYDIVGKNDGRRLYGNAGSMAVQRPE